MRAIAAAAGLALVAGACTVDVGQTPDAGPCFAPPAAFAAHVWPEFVDANRCATPSCHDWDQGSGAFRLHPPGGPQDSTAPLDAWRPAWRDDYYQVVQLLDCARPSESRLLTVPEARGELHEPGDVVGDHAAAEALIVAWVQGTL